MSVTNWRKMSIYILIAFAISWITAGIINLCGLSLKDMRSIGIIAIFYMGGPAIAAFITQKIIYRKNLKIYGWNFDRKAIKWVALTPVLFIALLFLAFLFVGLFGNTHLINEFGQIGSINQQFLAIIQEKMPDLEINSFPLFSIFLFFAFLIGGIIIGITFNLPLMLGEEFGWRGLLLEEARDLGFFKSSLFIGFIWGIWHLPLILMGHNYPNYPYWGILMMTVFTISVSPLFSYVRLKTNSIVGTCMLHGMINANAGLFTLFVANGNELFASFVGVAGVLSGIAMSLLIYIFDKPFIQNFRSN